MSEIAPVNLLLVINPKSGDKPKQTYEEAITKFFEPDVYHIELFRTSGKNDAQSLQEAIEKHKPQIVIAIGGDGTISLVVKKILGTDIKLGIVPAGSANGMARELNIPKDIEEALKIIKEGITKKADVISINNLVCFHLSDIGLNARLIKYFEEGNMRGKWGYAKVALKVLLRKTNIRLIIKSKDKEYRRDAFMVVLANASKYGTGAIINPKGDLYDGMFEVVLIKNVGIMTFLKMWLQPNGLSADKIEVIPAESVTIETNKKMHFQVDGEYIGKVHKVVAKILPSKLNIILPNES